MRMPHGHRAWIPAEKLDQYLLDEAHPGGHGKATLFRALLGITTENKSVLERALLDAAANGDVTRRTENAFGIKYEIPLTMTSGRGAYNVTSVWIVPADEDRPRLVTAYVK